MSDDSTSGVQGETSTISPGYKNPQVDFLSLTSLFLKLYVNATEPVQIATGTGFVVRHKGRPFLISAAHIFSGRHWETRNPLDKLHAALPDQVRFPLRRPDRVASWKMHHQALLDKNGHPLWLVHPMHGADYDVAALHIQYIASGYEPFPLDLSLADTSIPAFPAMAASVIGFPLGLRNPGLFPIWKTGHIASEPDYSFDNEHPAFLIDATTRNGMSGAPVVIRDQNSRHIRYRGAPIPTRLMGVYSSRIHEEAEIGIVWHPSVITEILVTCPPELVRVRSGICGLI